jgi:hypothetical protein
MNCVSPTSAFQKIQTGDQKCVAAFDPEVIGISLRNIDDVLPKRHSHLNEYRKLWNQYENTPQLLLYWEVRASRSCRGASEYLRADYGIAGEGEKAFPNLFQDSKQ